MNYLYFYQIRRNLWKLTQNPQRTCIKIGAKLEVNAPTACMMPTSASRPISSKKNASWLNWYFNGFGIQYKFFDIES